MTYLGLKTFQPSHTANSGLWSHVNEGIYARYAGGESDDHGLSIQTSLLYNEDVISD
jgi:hypothetical protein